MLKIKQISEFFEIPYQTVRDWKAGRNGLKYQKLFYVLSLQDKEKLLQQLKVITKNYKKNTPASKVCSLLDIYPATFSNWKQKREKLYKYLTSLNIKEIEKRLNIAKELGLLIKEKE